MASTREQREQMVGHLRQEITRILEETKGTIDSLDSIRTLKTTENRLKKLFTPGEKKQGASLEAHRKRTKRYNEEHKEELREKRKTRYQL